MSSSAAIPSGRVPPSGLGISTRRTGGARYAPPCVQASVQVEQSLFQSFAVLVPRDAVDARRSVPLQCVERPVQRVRRNVVEERSETLLRVSLCSFPYPGRRLWHASPTLGSVRDLAIRIPLS